MAKTKLLVAATLAFSTSPLALLAQNTLSDNDARAADGTPLGVIVLDADAPAQVVGTGPNFSLDAAGIARSQASTLTDVLRDAPSVTTTRRGNLLTAGISIRGFGGNHHYQGDPATKIVVDGVADNPGRHYQGASGAISDPALLRSVDVTTGPLASLEYGSGITGGAVTARTINGSDLTGGEDGFRFRQMLGANSNGDGWVTSSTLAWQANSTVDFLFNYTRRGQDAQEDPDGNETARGFNVPSMLFKSRFRLDDANSLTFSYTRYESSESNVNLSSMLNDYAGLGLANIDRKGNVAALTWNHNPAGNDLVDLELSVSRSDQDHNIDGFGSAFAISQSGLFNTKTDRVTLTNTARFDTGVINHRLRAGLAWSSEDRTRLDTSPASGKDRRLSLFAIDTMDFGNELLATIGLRLEDQKISATTAPQSYDNLARTLGFGLEKGFGNGVKVFGSFTYTEALPTYDVLTTYDDKLQQSRNWEGGLRYEGGDLLAAGDTLRGSVTLYHSDIWNTMFALSVPGRQLKRQGVEIAAHYTMAGGTYLNGTVNLTDNERLLAGGVWDLDTYSPSDTLTLTVGHKFANGIDLSWRMEAQKSITVGTTRHAGFAAHDLKVSYIVPQGSFEGLAIDFGVENVFDRSYHYAMTPISAATGKPWVTETGRNFRLNLSKTF
ncbi:TonB-dependent receptor plug domain-containing protein [Xinfangfangia sp. D13-10-4-6]|uniref:TonB-dependent receptor n=1 Tax=Pseudogemmobacter hezensis TaxID=2737662 RepID=UPI0015549617|nr:TonB-dependent receptor plug domain-containing protein [Pseudogemmobacter hezensis]NPD16779.1 TonB-dependent receptor plug domain-containing protein [Pseudogemmobacter hezensis]